MATFTLPVVQQGLRNILKDEPLTQKALVELKRLMDEKSSQSADKEPAEKKAFVVIRPEASSEIAWIVRHAESIHPSLVPEMIREAIASYNASRKGRLFPANTLGEGLEQCPPRFFKELGLSVSTKLPVTLLAMAQELDLKTPIAA
jgi:hypothetical protein